MQSSYANQYAEALSTQMSLRDRQNLAMKCTVITVINIGGRPVSHQRPARTIDKCEK
ncbi:Uncharacterised protein [Yersinia enterocolitica]|nr:Uncharacterised protein [Yersinia enterocolitica]